MQGGFQACRIAIRQFEVPAGEPQMTISQPAFQFLGSAQITGRTQVNPVIAGSLDLIEHLHTIRDVGVNTNGDFEGAKADGRVGNNYPV